MHKSSRKLEARIDNKSQLTPDPRVKFKINAGGVYSRKYGTFNCKYTSMKLLSKIKDIVTFISR